jgi:WD40 repeat protein
MSSNDEPASEATCGPGDPGAGDDTPEEPPQHDAFVSYRRLPADTAFVKHLQETLAERGKQVWVDQEQIEPAAEWEKRITRGIEAAKAFIFVITPESTVSTECRNELEKAAQRHKLIIPVVLREVNRRGLPDSLTKLNWIFFGQGRGEERALDDVIVALEDDLDWRDEHTRLAVRAAEWAESPRDRSLLLRGRDLRQAEKWHRAADKHVKTPPTPLQARYIRASRKTARRRWVLTGSSAAIALVVALVATVLAYQGNQAATSNGRAVLARKLVAAAQGLSDTQPRTSLLLSVEALKLDPTDPYIRDNLISGLAQTHYAGVLTGHASPFTALAFSPDGNLLADGSTDGTLILWDVSRTGHWKQLAVLKSQSTAVNAVAFAPDGKTLATVNDAKAGNSYGTGPGGLLIIWDITDRSHPVQQAAIPDPGGVDSALAFSPDGSTIAADAGSGIAIFDITNPSHPAPVAHLATHQIVGPTYLAFSPDGHTLLGAVDVWAEAGEVILWDVADSAHPRLLSTLHISHAHDDGLAAALSPDGTILATSSTGDAATLWDIRNRTSPEPIAVLHGVGRGGVIELAFAPDGRSLAAAHTDHTVNLWNVDNPAQPGLAANLAGHAGVVYSLAFSSSEHLLATGSNDTTTILWNVSAPAEPRMLASTVSTSPGKTLTAVAFDPKAKGSLLATVSNGQRPTSNGEVTIWDTGTGGRVGALGTLSGSDHQVLGISLSPDGQTAATANSDGTVIMWDIADPTHARREAALAGRQIQLSSAGHQVAFSPDGRTIASATSAGWTLWDNSNRHLTRLADIPDNESSAAIAFSPDGNMIAISENVDVALWNISDRTHPRLLSQLPDRAGILMPAAFSPNGHMLATIPAPFAGIPPDWTAVSPKLWDVTDHAHPALLATLPTHPGIVALNAAFSADGNLLATANDDGTKILWDVTDGRHPVEMATLPGNPQSAAAIAIAPDDQALAAGSTTDSATLWSIGGLADIAANPVTDACSIAGPGLTTKDWTYYIPNIAYQPVCP